jgi:superoxide dismutase
MNKTYRTIDEITDIFGITLQVARKIIKKHKVDTFTSKGIKIHIKDFYKAYTTHYNPSLFEWSMKTNQPKPPKNIDEIFQKLFGSPYSCKK